MTRLLLTLAIVLCACTAAANHSHAALCTGNIDMSGTTVTGKTQYDPFSATPVFDSYEIRVTNTSATSCTFALNLVSSTAPETRLSKALVYTLTNVSGRPITVNPVGTPPVMGLISSAIASNATYVFQYRIAIDRGQFAPPGTYTGSLILELYNFEGSQFKPPRLDSKTLAISYTVPQSLSVNLKGGDPSTTLSFEPFTKGAQRSVLLEARSNRPYQLNVTSDKQGVMLLTPPIPGKDWTVAYRASMAGRPLDLRQKAVISNLPPTYPRSDAVYNFVVTIGDISNKRAGKYEDTITVEIVGSPP